MNLTTAMMNQINTGRFNHDWFVTITAKNRQSGLPEVMNLWTGGDDMPVTIGDETITFIGSGQVLDIPAFSYKTGLDIQTTRMQFAILSPEIQNVFRAYDSDQAPIQIYLGISDPQTLELKGVTIAFDGFIDEITISQDEFGEICEVGIVSDIREGTKQLVLMKSDESQKLRNPQDNGFAYSSIGAAVKVTWGIGEGHEYPRFRNRIMGAR